MIFMGALFIGLCISTYGLDNLKTTETVMLAVKKTLEPSFKKVSNFSLSTPGQRNKVEYEKTNDRILIYIGAGTAGCIFMIFLVVFLISQRRRFKQIKRKQIADSFLRKHKGYVYKEPLFPADDQNKLTNTEKLSSMPTLLGGSYEVVGVMERKHVPCLEKSSLVLEK